MESEHGIIDDVLFFDLRHTLRPDLSPEDLHVGNIVRYLAYRLSDDIPVHIVRIEALVYDDWDNNGNSDRSAALVEQLRDERPEIFAIIHRSVHGEVIARRKRFVTIDLGNDNKLDIDLDEVRATFVPQCGDLVVLDCRVQEDPTFVDMTGDVLDVISMHPTRSKCEEGIVTAYDESNGVGVVNRLYSFEKSSLDGEYARPQKGDRVSVEVIEHNGEVYSWRCLKVVSMQTNVAASEQQSASHANVSQEQKELKANKNGLEISEDLRVSSGCDVCAF